MASPLSFARLLLLSSALVTPNIMTGTASAQETPAQGDVSPAEMEAASAPAEEEEQFINETEVSIPGSIIVTGRRNANIQKAAPAVVSVLSSADIQRTGEGDFAGALGRVTGLSVVGGGFVYVRGLGDRYSLALLNGSPLPSPEPLKRVVPLDIFPTNIIASSLVQKSYSANFPGEFGGGVINLTTKAIPNEDFLTIGAGLGGNSETTGQLGYTYYGSKTDWTGFDNGNRDAPAILKDYFASGLAIGDVDSTAIIKQIIDPRDVIVQRNDEIPVNFSANITAGKRFELGASDLGIIATFGYSNKWRTRSTTNQVAASADLSTLGSDFTKVVTGNRIVVNSMLGMGLEFDNSNRIRWTNLYVRDTLKQASIKAGSKDSIPGADYLGQSTAWYERQLIDTQLVGEFNLDGLDVDIRAGYANSQREAPYEFDFEYVRTNRANETFGDFYVNLLDNQKGSANVAFSDLSEDLYSFGLDLGYEILPRVTLSAGYAFSDTKRESFRQEFFFKPDNSTDFENQGIALFRPDYLLGSAVAEYYGIRLFNNTTGAPTFIAKLKTDAGYVQIQGDIIEGLNANLGVRYERAIQEVRPKLTANAGVASFTDLSNDYWLPALTLTYELAPRMQVRLNASKTIARPQFRELLDQSFYDPESNRLYRGNPFLTDSELFNAEARFEWYFARDQRFSLSGFFKKIDKPIEAYVSILSGTDPIVGYANAPEAQLYGAELEVQKYFDLSGMSDDGFFSTRRAVVVGNYTYTKSKIKVAAGDMVTALASGPQLASDFFADGDPLTGQSDHLVNLQIGLEDIDSLSQQTLLLTYASKRVTSRGPGTTPDIYEYPGLNIDFVVRQGFTIKGVNTELKLEARNLTGRKYEEYQESGGNRVYFNRYKMGTSYSASLSVKF